MHKLVDYYAGAKSGGLGMKRRCRISNEGHLVIKNFTASGDGVCGY